MILLLVLIPNIQVSASGISILLSVLFFLIIEGVFLGIAERCHQVPQACGSLVYRMGHSEIVRSTANTISALER